LKHGGRKRFRRKFPAKGGAKKPEGAICKRFWRQKTRLVDGRRERRRAREGKPPFRNVKKNYKRREKRSGGT